MRRTREKVVALLGVRRDSGGLTVELLDAALVRPLPFRAVLSDSGGRAHVVGLFIIINAQRPGPKGKPVPGSTVFYAQRRVGSGGGSAKQVRIGDVSIVSLDDARVRAREVLNMLARGVDPTAEKAKARVEEQSRVLARAYVEGDYWRKHLANKKSGEAEKDRLLAAWKDVLALRLDEVTADGINDVLQARRTAGLSAGTLLRDWNALRAMLYTAVEDGVLAAVPFKATPPAIRGLQGEKRRRYLGEKDPGEAKRFEQALAEESAEVQAALKLLALSGMRRGELLGLKRSEVRTRDGVAIIPPERSKSGKERIVRLNPEALKVLGSFSVVDVNGRYFPGSLETWKVRLKRAMKRIRSAAKLADFRLHDLRHHYAVRARQAGAPLEVVRDLLGHADIRSTQIYAHVGADELRDAVAKVRL